ncbi:hypothetical protein [Brachybacterium sacelli]|uniref:Peptidoglycan/LPS O-acetylase OafA/YrhL n=1 Tax=Brachybacterium sacelli TaxID=173364 RepID=A0ABS4X5J2_9MICO|nr:hypothetical protein [Brachybacterium sacelli]MBP2383727.1 peptidoglycan/LPS O-acetylase OafA/YrhL [Brachybacterium sacelli]
MVSTTRESVHIIISTLMVLSGATVVLGQRQAWTAARVAGTDDLLLTTTGGVLLIAMGIGAFLGSLDGLPTRSVVAFGALGYSIGLLVALLVATLITQSWEPLIGFVASAALLAIIVRAAQERED